MIKIRRFDHLVLTVVSIEITVDFYSKILGMEAVSFAEGRTALHFGSHKINLHQLDHVVDSNVRHATPGSTDFCLLLDVPLEEAMASLVEAGVRIITGPVERTGATGQIRSVYFYDPDENLIELAEPI